MLLPDNIHPENTIYYNGAFVLKELQKRNNQDMIELYQNAKQACNLTFPVYVLCLDWLYLLGAAKLNNGNLVRLCS